jgi:hypothetical protein
VYFDGTKVWESYDGDPAALYTNATALADFTLDHYFTLPAIRKAVLVKVNCAGSATTGTMTLNVE